MLQTARRQPLPATVFADAHNIRRIVPHLHRDRLIAAANDPEIAMVERAFNDPPVAPEAFTILDIFLLQPAEDTGKVRSCGPDDLHFFTSPIDRQRACNIITPA